MKYYLIADPDYNEDEEPREVELTKYELEHINGLGLTIEEYNTLQSKIRKVLKDE